MQFLYQFGPGDRPELATDSTAWTEEGTVIPADRSPDGVGPAIVIFESESEKVARQFMQDDPFVKEGLFTAELYPFRVALLREGGS